MDHDIDLYARLTSELLGVAPEQIRCHKWYDPYAVGNSTEYTIERLELDGQWHMLARSKRGWYAVYAELQAKHRKGMAQ